MKMTKNKKKNNNNNLLFDFQNMKVFLHEEIFSNIKLWIFLAMWILLAICSMRKGLLILERKQRNLNCMAL